MSYHGSIIGNIGADEPNVALRNTWWSILDQDVSLRDPGEGFAGPIDLCADDHTSRVFVQCAPGLVISIGDDLQTGGSTGDRDTLPLEGRSSDAWDVPMGAPSER